MEWKEVKIGDLGQIITGKTPKTAIRENWGGKIPFLSPSDDMSNKTSPVTARTLTELGVAEVAKCLIPANSICVSCIGSDLGKVVKTDRELVTNQQINTIVPHSNIDSDFVYYLMCIVGKELNYISKTSTAVPIINKSTFSDWDIVIPREKEDQRRIASILSSLDQKIELNNKINADLEEMAQAIFKNWFVDFEPFKDGKFVDSELGMIPEGWKVGKITDIGCLITDYVSNGSFASLKQNVHLYETKEYAQFIRNTDLKTNTFSVYVDKHSYDFLSKSTLYGNEIIISNVGDVGSVHLCPKLDIPMTLGNNIIMLRPNEKEYNYFLYLWFKYFSGQALIQGIKGGSAQPKFNKTDFKNLPLLIPSFEIIERSYWIFESMFSILSSNVKENSRLSLLRDTLLPRLMSGELEVPE